MTTIDRKAVIAKARKVSQAVYLATDKGVADDIRDTIESLLALVPEPAEDELEGLESIVQAEDERRDGARSSVRFSTRVADAVLAAGLTRRPLPSREQIAEALAKGYSASPYRDAHLRGADAVLALFEEARAGREVTHDHRPVQHRDGKEPWCKVCGLNRNHEEPYSRLWPAIPGGDS